MNKCVDCKNIIREVSKRCRNCFMKWQKINPPNKGKKLFCSKKHRQNLSFAHLGKKHSSETIQKMKISSHKGKNHYNWKDGKTSLSERIRFLSEFSNWRKQIYERDNYTCQKCFKKGVKLNSHHIKPFAIILAEFLQEYNQFSPIEDKETLVRLAITYTPFWEVKNGITYCKKCHKEVNHYWLIPNMRNVNAGLFKNQKSD